ncbi:hypothetical protein V565_198400, partial [Rhizoctonia solani 123E]
MFDSVMRSGRVYDPGQPPDYPKRRTRKSRATDEPEATQTPATHVSETPVESGGEVPAEEPAEESLVLRGKGKRKSVTWTEDEGVKLSPSAYKPLTHRPPPIRRPSMRQSIESTTSRPTAEAELELVPGMRKSVAPKAHLAVRIPCQTLTLSGIRG